MLKTTSDVVMDDPKLVISGITMKRLRLAAQCGSHKGCLRHGLRRTRRCSVHSAFRLAGSANRSVAATSPASAPSTWPKTNAGTEAGAMPENVSVNDRANVTVGFANDVEAVNQ